MREWLAAYLAGARDGWQQWREFSSGITWSTRPDLNLAYDQGVNLGQLLSAIRRVVGR